MEDDPVIVRIREARHRISEACGHDPALLHEGGHFRRWGLEKAQALG